MIDCIHSSGLIPALWGCDAEMSVKVMRGDKLKHPVCLLSGGSVVRGVEWHNTCCQVDVGVRSPLMTLRQISSS